MPIKNGIQVVQELKEFYQKVQKETSMVNLQEPLFVMLTAYKTLSFEKHVKQLGVDECYEKPIDRDQLVHILLKASE
jgi:YesN/AraC family two-component response regulator